MTQRRVYPDGLKTCRTCGETKLLTDFYQYARKSGPSPLSECKPCSIARTSGHWQANRDRLNAERNARRRADPSLRVSERAADPFGSVRRNARSRCKRYGATFEVVDYRAIVDRDDMRCQICLDVVTWDTLTFDDIIPLSRGGHHVAGNLQLAHRVCNSRKGVLLPGEPMRPLPIARCPNCAHEFVP